MIGFACLSLAFSRNVLLRIYRHLGVGMEASHSIRTKWSLRAIDPAALTAFGTLQDSIFIQERTLCNLPSGSQTMSV